MKKIFALTIAAMIILTCFTACKPKIKNGELVTDAAGENIAIATQADGGLQRDDSGNIIVLVTDEDGRNVKDENGEYATKAVALEHALVIGNQIECADYAIRIPNGWSDSLSYTELIIKKDGTEDTLSIANERGGSLKDTLQLASTVYTNMQAGFPSAVIENKKIEVLGMEANFLSGYVADNGTGKGSYIAYILFEHENSVYTCNLISDRNMSENLDEYIDILNTIEFR